VQLPVEIIDQINNIGDTAYGGALTSMRKGNCLAAWNKVQRPKSQGGLGIISLCGPK
jgi:hypothetical protein